MELSSTAELGWDVLSTLRQGRQFVRKMEYCVITYGMRSLRNLFG